MLSDKSAFFRGDLKEDRQVIPAKALSPSDFRLDSGRDRRPQPESRLRQDQDFEGLRPSQNQEQCHTEQPI